MIGRATHLTYLHLKRADISDQGLQHLQSLKQLNTLILQYTNVSPDGVAQLQGELPNCLIENRFSLEDGDADAGDGRGND